MTNTEIFISYMTDEEITKKFLETMAGPYVHVRYRFTDDPEDMVRIYKGKPTYDAKTASVCLIPAAAMQGKSYILLENTND